MATTPDTPTLKQEREAKIRKESPLSDVDARCVFVDVNFKFLKALEDAMQPKNITCDDISALTPPPLQVQSVRSGCRRAKNERQRFDFGGKRTDPECVRPPCGASNCTP